MCRCIAKCGVRNEKCSGSKTTAKILCVGSSGSNTAKIMASSTGNGKLTYSSSDKTVAKVSSSGKITAKGKGTATIIVKAVATTNYKSATKTFKVTVKKLSVPTLSSVKNFSSKKMKVKWKKVSAATGIRFNIQRVKSSVIQQKSK